jgi:hypothetical protein
VFRSDRIGPDYDSNRSDTKISDRVETQSDPINFGLNLTRIRSSDSDRIGFNPKFIRVFFIG